MIYRSFIPSPALQKMVKCIWVLEDDTISPANDFEKILPDGSPELLFHYGDLFLKKENGTAALQQRSFLFGQLTSFIELKPTGKIGVLGIKFHPHGLYQLTGIPQWELNDTAIEMQNIFGKGYHETEEKIDLSFTMQERVRHAENFLLQQVAEQSLKKKKDCAEINHALRVLADPFEKKNNNSIASQLFISKRELERRFATIVGLSPTQYAKIIRFQYIFQVKEKMQSLTALAHAAGYYDQSHFIRDFKAIAGINPASFFKKEARLTETFIEKK